MWVILVDDDSTRDVMGGWADDADDEHEHRGGGAFRETAREHGREYAERAPRNEHQNHHHEQRERHETPFPTKPPYTAFVGNVPYEGVSEEEVVHAVAGDLSDKIVNVRVVMDRSRTKVRGYFVEFSEPEALRRCIGTNGASLGDRPLRVNVAEERSETAPRRRNSGDQHRRGYNFGRQETDFGDGAPAPAAERKRLVLKPRSVEVDADAPISVNSSIFGGAKPVDTTKVFAEVEKKIDAETGRVPAPLKKTPTKEHHRATPTLKIHEEKEVKVVAVNAFSVLSLEEDE